MSKSRPRSKRAAPELAPERAHDVTRDHNVGNRRDSFQGALKRVYGIDQDIASLVEEHIKPLREDRGRLIKDMKERFDLPSKVFRARYAVFKLERDAIAAGDDAAQDAIRELFEVCPVTGQGSFAAAITSTAPPKPANGNKERSKPGAAEPAPVPPTVADDPESAWQEGFDARGMDRPIGSCTYPKLSAKRLRFEEGWTAHDKELRRVSGETEPETAS